MLIFKVVAWLCKIIIFEYFSFRILFDIRHFSPLCLIWYLVFFFLYYSIWHFYSIFILCSIYKREIIISRQIPDSQSLVLTSNLYANDAVMYEIDYCIHTALICKRRGMFQCYSCPSEYEKVWDFPLELASRFSPHYSDIIT